MRKSCMIAKDYGVCGWDEYVIDNAFAFFRVLLFTESRPQALMYCI